MRTMRALAAATILAGASIAVNGQAHEFTYSGAHGPAHWAQTPGWEACANSAGARQSPIAIDKVTLEPTLTPLQIAAKETAVNLVNNGHTIEEEYEEGSTVVVDGVTYELAQFHFHHPAEHAIHGRHDPLEMHAVFAEPGSAKKVVVAQLFVIGAASPFLTQLLADGVPAKAGQHIGSGRAINVASAFVDLAHYYTYDGSLTTPPCSETVTWFVLQREGQVSQAQFRALAAGLGNDARPTQPLNHRTVRATAGTGS